MSDLVRCARYTPDEGECCEGAIEDQRLSEAVELRSVIGRDRNDDDTKERLCRRLLRMREKETVEDGHVLRMLSLI